MEKRSDVSRNGGNRVRNSFVSVKSHRLKTPKRVLVRSLYPAIVRVAGQSGESYVFEKSGAEVKVNALDVERLLAKRRGGCCGTVASPMFELA
jgi:hypothetical protein